MIKINKTRKLKTIPKEIIVNKVLTRSGKKLGWLEMRRKRDQEEVLVENPFLLPNLS